MSDSASFGGSGPQAELALYAPPAQADEVLVPARMVNEWVYCPRLAFLEWSQGEWASNADTAAGQRAHRTADDGPAPPLPSPDVLPDDLALRTRRVHFASERLGLVAAIDVLEATDGAVIPVDIKTGKRPHVADGAYLPERVQVCVQGLLLRDAGYRCDEGALWFADSRERVRVPLSDELVATTLRAASDLRLTVASGRAPPPLDTRRNAHAARYCRFACRTRSTGFAAATYRARRRRLPAQRYRFTSKFQVLV